MENNLSLVTTTNPLAINCKEARQLTLPPGLYVQDIVDRYYEYRGIPIIVYLNGSVLPKILWATTEVKDQDFIVICPELSGGTGGAKSIFRMILMLAISVAAFALAPIALPALGIGVTSATTGMFVAGVTMIGGLLVNALLPPTSPVPDDQVEKVSQAYSWNPANTQSQGVPLARWYGTHRVYGNVVQSYLSNFRQSQFMYVISNLGIGPVKGMRSFKLNDQPAGQFHDATIAVRHGTLGQKPFEFIHANKIEYPVSQKVVKATPYDYTTQENDADGYEIDITLPNGVWSTIMNKESEDYGKLANLCVLFRIQYRKQGSGTWLTMKVEGDIDTVDSVFYGFDGDPNDDGVIECADTDILWNNKTSYYTYNGDMVPPRLASTVVSPKDGLVYMCKAEQTPNMNKCPPNDVYWTVVDTSCWTAGKWYTEESNSTHGGVPRVKVWGIHHEWTAGTDPPRKRLRDGDWYYTDPNDESTKTEFKWRYLHNTYAKTVPTPTYTMKMCGNATNLQRNTYSFNIEEADKDYYEIRVTKLSDDYDGPEKMNIFYVGSIRATYNERQRFPRQALMAAKVRATDQISGALNFSCLLDGAIVQTWDGATRNGAGKVSTSGSSTTVTTTDDAFDHINIGDEIIANKQQRHVVSVVDENTVIVHEAVNWSDGYSWEWRNWTLEWSNNPAWVAYDIVTQPVIDGDGMGQNKFFYSNEYNVDNWGKTVIILDKVLSDPFGGTDGARIRFEANKSDQYVKQTITCTEGKRYFLSCWIRRLSGVVNGLVMFDEGDAVSDTARAITSEVTDEWKRIRRSFVATSSATATFGIRANTSSGGEAFHIGIYGMQIEEDYMGAFEETDAANCDFVRTPYVIKRFDGINRTTIDVAKFKEFADFCDEEVTYPDSSTGVRVQFNGGFDYDTSMWEALLKVCAIGRAVPVWNGIFLTLSIDKAVTTPVNLFSVGNITENSFKETFLPLEERATVLECDYTDEENDYQRDKLTIYRSDLTKETHFRADFDATGITDYRQAWHLGMYRLLCNRYLTRVVEINVDIEALNCTVGDVVYVQHDVPSWNTGGRIVDVAYRSVTLDKEVTIQEGTTYQIMVRTTDDVIQLRTVTSKPGTHTSLALDRNWRPEPKKYDVYIFGPSSQVTRAFRVMEISRAADFSCDLKLLEYREEVYQNDDVAPPRNAKVNQVLRSYQPTKVALERTWYRGNLGFRWPAINCTFTKSTKSGFSHYKIWYREKLKYATKYTEWLYGGMASDSPFTIFGEELNRTAIYEVVFCPVLTSGKTLDPDNARIYEAELYMDPSGHNTRLYGVAGPVGSQVSTSGSSTTVTTTDDAFVNVTVGTQIIANSQVREVVSKTDNNTVEVSEAVDWSAGYDWTFDPLLDQYAPAEPAATLGAVLNTNVYMSDRVTIVTEADLFLNGLWARTITLTTGGVFQSSETYPKIVITQDEIAGYSDVDTKEFYLDADTGKAYAGGGNVILDSTGVTVVPSAECIPEASLKFGTFGQNPTTQIYGTQDAAACGIYIDANPQQYPTDRYAVARITAIITNSAKYAEASITAKRRSGAFNFDVASLDLLSTGGLGTATLTAGAIVMAGPASFDSQITSQVATGTAPLVIGSTTKVTNLNADQVDGKDAADFFPINGGQLTGANISRNVDDSYLNVHGATNVTSGAGVTLYGRDHATCAGNMYLTFGGYASTGKLVIRNRNASEYNNVFEIDSVGNIVTSALRIGAYVNDSYLSICAGEDGLKGASLAMYGRAHASAPGEAFLTLGGYTAYGKFTIRQRLTDESIVNLFCFDKDANFRIGGTTFGTSAAKVLCVGTGTAPTSSPADAFQMYSKDVAAGNACPHILTEAGDLIRLYATTHLADTDATTLSALTGAYGSAGTAIVDVGTSFDQTKLNNNFRRLEDLANDLRTVANSLRTRVDGILARMENVGIMKSS